MLHGQIKKKKGWVYSLKGSWLLKSVGGLAFVLLYWEHTCDPQSGLAVKIQDATAAWRVTALQHGSGPQAGCCVNNSAHLSPLPAPAHWLQFTGCVIHVINFFPFSMLPISSHFVPGNLLCVCLLNLK